VLFFDGIAVYNYYQVNDNKNINLPCGDVRISSIDIHRDLNYVPVELAGAVTSVMLYVSEGISWGGGTGRGLTV